MAAAEAERAELDAQREELIAFETACAENQERLQALCRKEGQKNSARAREMQELEEQTHDGSRRAGVVFASGGSSAFSAAMELLRHLLLEHQAAVAAQEERLDAAKLVRTFETLLNLVQELQGAQLHKVERKADTKAWPEASICSELEEHLERGVTVLLSMDDGMERTVFHRGGAAHVHELCQALQQQYTAIEGAVTDAQNRKLGWQQNLTRYEKHCSSSGSTGDRAREAEIREYYKSHLAVAEAHLLELQERCKPLQACRPLHTQGGVDTHCLAEEESCAGDKGGRNHNAHEELQQALQQSVRFIKCCNSWHDLFKRDYTSRT